jgi:hypothetical protein
MSKVRTMWSALTELVCDALAAAVARQGVALRNAWQDDHRGQPSLPAVKSRLHKPRLLMRRALEHYS